MFEAKYVLVSDSLSDEELITQIEDHARSLVVSETNLIANCANVASLVFNSMKNLNWCGFYLWRDDELVLGPFQGKPACTRIKTGKGVCGTAALEKRTIVVDDVQTFQGHIACDPDSRSEVVVPLLRNNIIVGVMDIDSPTVARFSDVEVRLFERLTQLVLTASLPTDFS